MVVHMKTTLNIPDVTMRAVKDEALRRGRTMSELVDASLRSMLKPAPRKTTLPPLPEYSGGGARVNVADRNALYDVMGR